MFKYTIIILIMLMLVGCAPASAENFTRVNDVEKTFTVQSREHSAVIMDFHYSYICIDGIEYLFIFSEHGTEGYAGITTHFDKYNNVVTCYGN